MTEKAKQAIIRAVYGAGRQPPKGGNPDFEVLLEVIDDVIEEAVAEALAEERAFDPVGPEDFFLGERWKPKTDTPNHPSGNTRGDEG